MTDQLVLVVVTEGKDELGSWKQIVAIHHDSNRGNGDPNEEFWAVTLNRMPGGSITTMTKREFALATKHTYPWLYQMVNLQFSRAKTIRAAKKLKNIEATRKVTALFLRRALQITIG